MKIRDLKKEELSQLALIDKQVNPSYWQLSGYEEAFKHERQNILGVFTTEEILTGGIVYAQVMDEAEILQLCIAEQFQRLGLASFLLESLFEIFTRDNIRQIFLEVRNNNTEAINLYHKLGFNIIAERRNYYRINGKIYDALLMAKTL